MKKELENAPPEPREPAAREFARNMFSESELVDGNGLLDWERIEELMLAYSAELRAERDKHRDESEFFQREMDNFRRNRDHRIVQLEAEIATLNEAWKEDLKQWGEEQRESRASLLQAREELEDGKEIAMELKMKATGLPDSSGFNVTYDVPAGILHKLLGWLDGASYRKGAKLASSSAPEGTV